MLRRSYNKALGLWMVFFYRLKAGTQTLWPQRPETSTAIWVHLPKLSTEFYDHQILAKVGRKLIKTDACTSSTFRGRYVRICEQVPIGIPVKKCIIIGKHKQTLIYEGENILCSKCGVLGHTSITLTNKGPSETPQMGPKKQARWSQHWGGIKRNHNKKHWRNSGKLLHFKKKADRHTTCKKMNQI